jgi:ATP-dependent helicase/nuclease subunit A
MHCKLDSRYRHILLDEFQDTNPQQWLALKGWFDAAVQADSVPAVFLVGDPKQAIFRFRRADARLFEAARAWLVRSHAAAVHARDESRRCAQPLLDVVNAVFAAEPAFAGFRTHRAHDATRQGRVEVLPLARNPAPASEAAIGGLRDPLRAAREVEDDRRREREAQLLVARLAEIVGGWWLADADEPAGGRPARYGDVMILVRRRTHLQVYERALRHAGMPFVTSRQGGLLDTLEAADLMALLAFLVSPFDDLSLAHALRSPIFACSDEDLMRIAQHPGTSWWQRLEALPAAAAGTRLARARDLLGRWLDWADRLPVHDVLDRIYFEGDVMRRYECAVPGPMRAAVAANLNAFIQRALDVDSGRYPSLPRFLAELRDMLDAPAEEAPDEGEIACGADAIRIMTVHGAKGLEAPIVWILDATATRPGERGFDVLVQWRPGEHAPSTFSLLTRSAERSRAQRLELQDEAGYAAREELNLLYVAMTRARQALIVSGCELRSTPDSWYARVRGAVEALTGTPQPSETAAVYGDALAPRSRRAAGDRRGAVVDRGAARTPAVRAGVLPPAQLQLDFERVGEKAAAPTAESSANRARPGLAGELPVDGLPAPVGRRRDSLGSRAQRYGITFHVLMQQATDGKQDLSRLAQRLGVDAATIAPMWAQACQLMADPGLARFFDPACFERALNEWPIVTAAGELRRVDRMVEFRDEVWVLDYKTGSRAASAGGELEAQYRAQVDEYCTALRAVFPAKRVCGLILFADGSRLAVEPSAPVRT